MIAYHQMKRAMEMDAGMMEALRVVMASSQRPQQFKPVVPSTDLHVLPAYIHEQLHALMERSAALSA
jgi:hypothetical protein